MNGCWAPQHKEKVCLSTVRRQFNTEKGNHSFDLVPIRKTCQHKSIQDDLRRAPLQVGLPEPPPVSGQSTHYCRQPTTLLPLPILGVGMPSYPDQLMGRGGNKVTAKILNRGEKLDRLHLCLVKIWGDGEGEVQMQGAGSHCEDLASLKVLIYTRDPEFKRPTCPYPKCHTNTPRFLMPLL